MKKIYCRIKTQGLDNFTFGKIYEVINKKHEKLDWCWTVMSEKGNHTSIHPDHVTVLDEVLIGYKVPVDIGAVNWKKDAIATVWPGSISKSYSVPNNGMVLPAEVVELWEPVYELATITVTIGTPAKEIIVTKDTISYNGIELNINIIDNLYNGLKNLPKAIHAWDIKVPSVKIGCSDFTESELGLVLETYNDLKTKSNA